METYKVRFEDKKQVAEGTMAFYFEKPAGFAFKAGQYCNWALTDLVASDREGNARDFSLASAPHEDFLMIASRMRDTAFKHALNNLATGAEIEVRGPIGALTLHDDASRPAVLLAGGIGITPFRSIALDAAYNRLPHQIYLFHANRRPQDAPFLELFQSLENPNCQFVGAMTQMEKSGETWTGETGHITKEMLAKYVGDLSKPIYYVAGPPAMLKSLRQTLVDAGVSESQVKAEEFEGY